MKIDCLDSLVILALYLIIPIKALAIPTARRLVAAPSMADSPETSTIPDKLLPNVPSVLVDHAVAWAAANGLGMVINDEEGTFTSSHLPFSLLPYGEMLQSTRNNYRACAIREYQV